MTSTLWLLLLLNKKNMSHKSNGVNLHNGTNLYTKIKNKQKKNVITLTFLQKKVVRTCIKA